MRIRCCPGSLRPVELQEGVQSDVVASQLDRLPHVQHPVPREELPRRLEIRTLECVEPGPDDAEVRMLHEPEPSSEPPRADRPLPPTREAKGHLANDHLDADNDRTACEVIR